MSCSCLQIPPSYLTATICVWTLLVIFNCLPLPLLILGFYYWFSLWFYRHLVVEFSSKSAFIVHLLSSIIRHSRWTRQRLQDPNCPAHSERDHKRNHTESESDSKNNNNINNRRTKSHHECQSARCMRFAIPSYPLVTRYEPVADVGTGSFGFVSMARAKDSVGTIDGQKNKIVAIKSIRKSLKNPSDYQRLREVVFLKEVPPSPFLVHAYEMFIDPRSLRLHIVMECMQANLYQLITAREANLTVGNIQEIMFQIIKGIKHIHDHGFFHRDIKPENLLVTLTAKKSGGRKAYLEGQVNYSVKLADFGLARRLTAKPPYTTYVATRWYRAPEMLLGASDYTSAVDIWAAGVVSVELFLRGPLFPGDCQIDQLGRIIAVLGSPNYHGGRGDSQVKPTGNFWPTASLYGAGHGFDFPDILGKPLEEILGPKSPKFVVDLVSSMIQWDPQKRPSALQVMQDEFFSRKF